MLPDRQRGEEGHQPQEKVHGAVQVKELLLPFGQLKAFNLVMDKNTGNSKVQLSLPLCMRFA